MPDNDNGSTSTKGPSDVQHDGPKDRLSDESKGKKIDIPKEKDKAKNNEHKNGTIEEDDTSGEDDGANIEHNTTKKPSISIDRSAVDPHDDQSKANKRKSNSKLTMKEDESKDFDEDEEEKEEEEKNFKLQHSGNNSSDNKHSNENTNKKSDSEATDSEESQEEDQVDTKPRVIKLDRRPSHDDSEEVDNDDNETTEEGENEEDEDYEEDPDNFASNVCTAEYFLDKIIPEDYPTEISKDVKHINETIERLNKLVNRFKFKVDLAN